MPKPNLVTFETFDPRIKVTAILGDGTVSVVGGFGGWEKINRPKRSELVEWGSRPLLEMEIPIMLDKFAQKQGDIERAVRRLERMARPASDFVDPPIVTVSGPVPHQDISWVINGFRWGPPYFRENGKRSRQPLEILLLEYSRGDNLIRSPAKNARESIDTPTSSDTARRRRKRKARGRSVYVVKRGDTLWVIAGRLLGDSNRWREIAEINNIRNPRTLQIGTKLQIPR